MMIEESQLTRCFEMLIERLDTVESRCETLEKHMQYEQDIKLGRINTSPWGLDISLYVYDHLFADESRPFERAHSYYVKTSQRDTEWEDLILNAALEGRFDDELRGSCDLEAMKQLLPRRENDKGPLMTSTLGLKSARLYVRDHLGDITIRRWVSRRQDCKWKSIQCNWDRDDGMAFWVTSPTDERNEYLYARTTVRDCCTILVDLIADFGGPSKDLEFQVCPLTDSGKLFLRRYELVCQREFEGVQDENTARLKKDLKDAKRKWPGLMAAIDKHSYWRSWDCVRTISGW